MEQNIEPSLTEHSFFPSQPFYVNNNLKVEKEVDSFLYIPDIQSSFGRENNMFNLEGEDVDDPEYLSEVELKEIEASLKDYAEGKFKRGSIDDLLKDLKD